MRTILPFSWLLLALPLAAQAPLPPGPLALDQAIELGRTRGVQAALARAAERVADSRVGQRRADLLPSLSGSAGWIRQTFNLAEYGIPNASGVTDPFSVYRFQLRGSQSLVDPAAWLRLSAARDSVIAAGLDARNAGALAGAAAGVAWLRVYSAQETVAARTADSATAQDLLEQSRRLFDAGVTTAIDLTRSEFTLSSIRADLLRARSARDRSRLDLARALDLPLTAPLAISDRIAPESLPLITAPDSAVAFARAHRADLAAEVKRLAVLGEGRRAIRAEQLPSLGMAGSVQQSGRHLSTLDGSWSLQFGLTVPIIDGFRRQYRSQEQAARISAQEIRVRDLTGQVEADVRGALLDLASAEELVAIAAERQRLAVLELQQAGDRFAAGVAGSLETSNAQLSLTSARDALIQARVAYGLARVGAMRALGTADAP
jgi:outer membrane protein TolC